MNGVQTAVCVQSSWFIIKSLFHLVAMIRSLSRAAASEALATGPTRGGVGGSAQLTGPGLRGSLWPSAGHTGTLRRCESVCVLNRHGEDADHAVHGSVLPPDGAASCRRSRGFIRFSFWFTSSLWPCQIVTMVTIRGHWCCQVPDRPYDGASGSGSVFRDLDFFLGGRLTPNYSCFSTKLKPLFKIKICCFFKSKVFNKNSNHKIT